LPYRRLPWPSPPDWQNARRTFQFEFFPGHPALTGADGSVKEIGQSVSR
jgi:hypothetical protein